MGLYKRCDCAKGLEGPHRRAAWRDCDHEWWTRFGKHDDRRSTGTNRIREAEKVERQRRAEADRRPRSGRPAPGSSYTLADVRDLDFARRRRRIEAKKTGDMREVTQHWRALFKIIDERTPAELVTGKLALAYDERKSEEMTRFGGNVHGTTIKRHLNTLWRGLRLAYAKGWIERMPTDWPTIDTDEEPVKALAGQAHSREVVAAWLAELTEDARDEAELISRTSLRGVQAKRWLHEWNELRLEGPRLDRVPAVARFPKGSAKNKRRGMVLPLTASVWEIVKRRRRANPDSPFVLSQQSHRTTYRRAVTRALKKEIARLEQAGMTREAAEADARRRGFGERIKRRDLRHYFATVVEKRSQDRKAVADIMGHTTLRTTERYLHSTEERVVEAMLAAEDDMQVGTTRSAQAPIDVHSEVSKVTQPPEPKAVLDGAKNGTRTRDLLITNQAGPAPCDVNPCPECLSINISGALLTGGLDLGRHKGRHTGWLVDALLGSAA